MSWGNIGPYVQTDFIKPITSYYPINEGGEEKIRNVSNWMGRKNSKFFFQDKIIFKNETKNQFILFDRACAVKFEKYWKIHAIKKINYFLYDCNSWNSYVME